MKIQLHDVLSLCGRDYVIEGMIFYEIAGRTSLVARAADGEGVVWIEWPGQGAGAAAAPATDRLLVLRQIRDLDLSAPPPANIDYQGVSYVQRLTGRATLEVSGAVPERAAGSAQLWRYRTAGDRVLQIEEDHGRLFMLAGQSVHRGMIDLLPGR
jgi:hypothetical protein